MNADVEEFWEDLSTRFHAVGERFHCQDATLRYLYAFEGEDPEWVILSAPGTAVDEFLRLTERGLQHLRSMEDFEPWDS